MARRGRVVESAGHVFEGGAAHVSLLLAHAQEFLRQGGVMPFPQPLVLPMEGWKGEREPGRAADESGLPERNPARPEKGAFWPLCQSPSRLSPGLESW